MNKPAPANQHEIAALTEEERLRGEMELMRRLNTFSGFYETFLERLKEHPTSKACFLSVNDDYERLFGIPRFSDFSSFRSSRANYLKK